MKMRSRGRGVPNCNSPWALDIAVRDKDIGLAKIGVGGRFVRAGRLVAPAGIASGYAFQPHGLRYTATQSRLVPEAIGPGTARLCR
jgi:hypothetical protein